MVVRGKGEKEGRRNGGGRANTLVAGRGGMVVALGTINGGYAASRCS